MNLRSLFFMYLILNLAALPMPAETPAERWDSRYDREMYLYGKEPVVFLEKNLDRLGQGQALVLAMGEGRNAVYLAGQGFEVTGVDVSKVGIAKANRLAAERGVQINAVEADLKQYDLGEESFDLITNFYFLERDLFPKIRAALKPGGIFILEHFSTDHAKINAKFGPKNPAYLLEPHEALAAFEGFRVLFYEDKITTVDEGMHRGEAALIRMIVQKPSS